MDIVSVVTAFILILLAESGDKTQLTVISLSCRYCGWHVFVGAMFGFFLVDGVSILVGASLTAVLPLKWITIASGIIFVLFGIFTLLSKNEEETKVNGKGPFPLFTSFYLVALGELGDKTQIAAIALAAETSWDSVLLGMMSAFAVLTGAATILGAKILVHLPKKWLRIGSASLFIFLGLVSIISAILGINII